MAHGQKFIILSVLGLAVLISGCTGQPEITSEPISSPTHIMETEAAEELSSPSAVPTTAIPLPTLTATITPSPTLYPLEGSIYFIDTTEMDDLLDQSLIQFNTTTGSAETIFSTGTARRCPVLSPISNQVAFIQYTDEGFQTVAVNVLVEDLDTGITTQITFGNEYDDCPAWSPDGSQLAFQSHRGQTSYPIFMVNIQTKALINITTNPDAIIYKTHFQWSPDSKSLLFTGADLNSSVQLPWALYLVDIDTGHLEKILSDDDANYEDPVWSPDGSKIALTSDQDGNQEIYILTLADNSLVRLTENNASDRNPTWSPGGQHIAFQSDRDGEWGIYVMNSDGGGLLSISGPEMSATDPQWYP